MLSKVKLLFLALVITAGLARADVAVGTPFPSLENAGLVGKLPELSGKVVLVDFCASWCAPCKKSFPALTALQNELGPRGLVIVGVSVDERVGDYDLMFKKWKPGFALLHDAQQKLVAQVAVPTMPTTFVLDRHGVVRFVHAGFHEDSEKNLRSEIESLLSDKS